MTETPPVINAAAIAEALKKFGDANGKIIEGDAPPPVAAPVEPETPADTSTETPPAPLTGFGPDREELSISKKKGPKIKEFEIDPSTQEAVTPGTKPAKEDSQKFKDLVASFEAKKEEAARLAEEVKKLAVHRDRYDLESSPEFYQKFGKEREALTEQATIVAEAYGVSSEQMNSVFQKSDLKEARAALDRLVTDRYANADLSKIVTDFFSSKIQQEKVLKDNDPAKRHREIREELARRNEKERSDKLQIMKVTRDKTLEDIDTLLDPKQGNKLFPNLFHSEVLEMLDGDMARELTTKAKDKFTRVSNALIERGAELDFDATRTLGILAADAVGLQAAERVIGILLEERRGLKKELKAFNKFANPSLREASEPPRSGESIPSDNAMAPLANAIGNVMKKYSV